MRAREIFIKIRISVPSSRHLKSRCRRRRMQFGSVLSRGSIRNVVSNAPNNRIYLGSSVARSPREMHGEPNEETEIELRGEVERIQCSWENDTGGQGKEGRRRKDGIEKRRREIVCTISLSLSLFRENAREYTYGGEAGWALRVAAPLDRDKGALSAARRLLSAIAALARFPLPSLLRFPLFLPAPSARLPPPLLRPLPSPRCRLPSFVYPRFAARRCYRLTSSSY